MILYFCFALLFLIIFWCYKCFIIIPQNKVAIVESIGKYSRTIHSGIHILLPFIEHVRSINWSHVGQDNQQIKLNFDIITERNNQMDIPPVMCSTVDSIPLNIDVTIFYDIENLKDAVYNSPDSLNMFYQNAVECVRNVFSTVKSEHAMGKDKALGVLICKKINENSDECNGIACKKIKIQSVVIREHVTEMEKRKYDNTLIENDTNIEMIKFKAQLEREKLQYEMLFKLGFDTNQIVELLRPKNYQLIKY